MTQADVISISGITDVAHGGLREPASILMEAQKRAEALIDVVKATGASQKIGDREHLKIEAWVTLGQFYGCTARCKETLPVTIDGVDGFHAKAQLVHDASGLIVSEAEAYCMRDEDRWNTRPKYEWVAGVKTQTGNERVPMFQLASMAQTRSMAKVIAAKFRWVVVLAGYAPTAAEEITGNETEDDHQTPKYTPKPKAKAPPAPAIPYGKYKADANGNAQRIDNPNVPTDYLQWMVDKTQATLKEIAADPKHKRVKFLAQDQLFLAALDAEIAARKAKQPAETPKQPQEPTQTAPGEAQPAKEAPSTGPVRQPFSEAAWAEYIRMWEDDWTDLYMATKDAFIVKSGHDLPVGQRFAFYDQMNAEITKAEK